MKNRTYMIGILALPLFLSGACGLEQAVQNQLNDANGSSTPPGTSLTGNVGGAALTAQTAIYASSTTAPGPSKNATLVLIGSDPNLCSSLENNTLDANSTMTALYLEDTSTGEYSAAPAALLLGRAAIFGAAQFDGNCKDTLQQADSTASGGTVQLTRMDAGSAFNGQAYGTFDLTVGPQNANVTGSFQATYCDALSNMENVLSSSGLLPSMASGGAAGFTCVNPN